MKTADAVFLPSEIRNELENELSTEKDTFAIKLSASPNAKTHLKYLDWLPPEEVEKVPAQLREFFEEQDEEERS